MISENSAQFGKKQILSAESIMGIRDTLPIVIGVIPFGITCGLMGRTVNMTGSETFLMSALVFAGASQFVGMSMLGSAVIDGGLIVLTTLLINLRHLLMGASLAPYLVKMPIWKQALLAFGIVDESYALTVSKIDHSGYSSSYQLAVSITLYLTWLAATLAGIFLGSYIQDPLKWGLDFAMPATFLALLMPRLKDRVGQLVAMTSGAAAVIAALYLPGKWHIIIAAVAASMVGGFLERNEADAD